MTLRRLLWLLAGLIYRLIVLMLTERWIPFPEQPPVQPSKPDAGPAKRRRAAASGHTRDRARPAPPALPSQPIFNVRLMEPAPERVATLESEHLDLRVRSERARARAAQDASAARPLRSLLRDRRALRSALILGEALADRRFRPK